MKKEEIKKPDLEQEFDIDTIRFIFNSCSLLFRSKINNYKLFENINTNNDINSIILDQAAIPAEILTKLNSQYEQFDGSTSSLAFDLKSQIFDVINTPSTEGDSISYYGAIPGTIYSAMTNLGFTASTNVYGVDSVDASIINFSASKNDPWYYSLFDNNGNASYSGYSFFSVVDGLTLVPVTTTTTIPTTTTTTTTNLS